MTEEISQLIEKLIETRSLSLGEYEKLIKERDPEAAKLLASHALRIKREVYGDDVFLRGIIEFSNICKNDCYYCGIRKSNTDLERYRMSKSEILESAKNGYGLGMRTFVLQSGEDAHYTDDMLCDIVSSIKKIYPSCAITLSIGERSHDSYQRLFDAGADRYLLRHETADEEHYGKLHPSEMSWQNRMECLGDLRNIGYAVGAGMMVGAPFQTERNLATDLKFIEFFKPEMCGIGPFIPHKDTPFAGYKQGTLELTLYLLSIIRIICPSILLPATTALGTIDPTGREQGIMAGANVIMPNISPVENREKYALYDNKICVNESSDECRGCIERRMEYVGAKVVVSRGDYKAV